MPSELGALANYPLFYEELESRPRPKAKTKANKTRSQRTSRKSRS